VVGLSIGFVGGYGVRELISRRRRAAAREEWFKRQDRKMQNRWTLEDPPDIEIKEQRVARRGPLSVRAQG